MIRVLNIISDTNIGGAGRVILNYLNSTDRDQFETLVAVPRGSLLKAPLEEAGALVYEVDGIAYVGEMTFTPGMFLSFTSKAWDIKLGEYLKLPIEEDIE